MRLQEKAGVGRGGKGIDSWAHEVARVCRLGASYAVCDMRDGCRRMYEQRTRQGGHAPVWAFRRCRRGWMVQLSRSLLRVASLRLPAYGLMYGWPTVRILDVWIGQGLDGGLRMQMQMQRAVPQGFLRARLEDPPSSSDGAWRWPWLFLAFGPLLWHWLCWIIPDSAILDRWMLGRAAAAAN